MVDGWATAIMRARIMRRSLWAPEPAGRRRPRPAGGGRLIGARLFRGPDQLGPDDGLAR